LGYGSLSILEILVVMIGKQLQDTYGVETPYLAFDVSSFSRGERYGKSNILEIAGWGTTQGIAAYSPNALRILADLRQGILSEERLIISFVKLEDAVQFEFFWLGRMVNCYGTVG
jgi:hypothetical protein